MIPAAVVASFDARQWSATTVMTWNGNNVTLPTFAAGEGFYFDPLDHLNGRCSGTEAFVGDVAAAWVASGAAGALTMSIDGDTGRVKLVSSVDDFAIGTGSGNAWWGFDSAGHALVGGAAPFERIAPNPHSLVGTFSGTLNIDPAGAPAAFNVGASRWWQDPITAMRERGVEGDADDVVDADSLEALIAAIGGASVRVGLDSDGHVLIAWRTGIANPGPPVWVSTTYRDRLGFSGLETMQTSGLVDYVVADYRLPGVYVVDDGLREYDVTASTTTSGERMIGGTYSAASYGTRAGATVQFDIAGPVVDTTAHVHWLERCVQYLTVGAPVTVYPRRWTVQRRLSPLDVTAAQDAHDLLYTTLPTYAPGYHGRRRGRITESSTQQHATAWRGESRTWWTVSIDMTDAE